MANSVPGMRRERASGEMRVYCSRKGFWDAAAMDIAA
jgi:hypothetical protein